MSVFRDVRRAKVGDTITFNGNSYIAVECKKPAPVGCCEGCPFLGCVCDELNLDISCIEHDIVFKPAAIDAANGETK